PIPSPSSSFSGFAAATLLPSSPRLRDATPPRCEMPPANPGSGCPLHKCFLPLPTPLAPHPALAGSTPDWENTERLRSAPPHRSAHAAPIPDRLPPARTALLGPRGAPFPRTVAVAPAPRPIYRSHSTARSVALPAPESTRSRSLSPRRASALNQESGGQC